MVKQGEWRPTAPFKGKRATLNGLCSLFHRAKATKHDCTKRLPSFWTRNIEASNRSKLGRIRFSRTRGKSRRNRSASPLLARCEPYAGKVPEDAVVLTCGVDCQDDRLEAEVVGWGLKECWVSSTKPSRLITNPATWSQLEQWITQPWEHEWVHRALPPDDRHRLSVEDRVRLLQTARGESVLAIKGCGANRPIKSRPAVATAKVVQLGVDSAKELYSRLKIEEAGAGYCHFPIGNGYDDEYFEQLTAEKAVVRIKNGMKTRTWQKTRARNEALDVRVYALAAFVNLNANLDQLAKSLKAKSVDENKPEAPPKADPYKAIHNRRPRSQNFATSWKT